MLNEQTIQRVFLNKSAPSLYDSLGELKYLNNGMGLFHVKIQSLIIKGCKIVPSLFLFRILKASAS